MTGLEQHVARVQHATDLINHRSDLRAQLKVAGLGSTERLKAFDHETYLLLHRSERSWP